MEVFVGEVEFGHSTVILETPEIVGALAWTVTVFVPEPEQEPSVPCKITL
jgi:hypothetical protein